VVAVDYSERLKSAMSEAKVTTSQLAEALGVSFQAVRKVENGGRFSAKNNAAAAKKLGVNSDWLATGNGPRKAGEAATSNSTELDQKLQQLLNDYQELMEDDQERFAREIAALAKKMRIHNARILWKAVTLERDVPPTLADLDPDEQFTTDDEERLRQKKARQAAAGNSARKRST
jgi:transcriptional regulator with XRE-family HTH domain